MRATSLRGGHQFGIVVTIVIAALLLAPVQVEGSDTEEREHQDNRNLDQDAILRDTEITEDELLHYFLVDDDIAAFREALSGKRGNAGVWIGWNPFTLNVALTPSASRDVLAEVERFEHSDILALHDREVDLTTIEAELRSLVRDRNEARLPQFEIEIDEIGGELVITLPDSDDLPDRLVSTYGYTAGRGSQEVVSDSGVRLRIEEGELSEPEYNGGGNLGNGCTAGFTVRRTQSPTQHGVMSAGHGVCRNATTYAGNSTSVPLWTLSARKDMSIHRLTSGTPRNRIDIAQAPTYQRTITSSRTWSQMGTGDPVCVHGRVGGYRCGTIASLTHAPSYVPNGERFVRHTSLRGRWRRQ